MRTRNVYYIHENQSAQLLCGDKMILVDKDDVEKISEYQWSVGAHGYATCGAGREQILLHRLILNPEEGTEVDHLNQNKLDNRKENLRIVNRQQNGMNRPSQANNLCGYKGVCETPNGKWQAQIVYGGKAIYLGQYEIIEDAVESYDTAALTLFGEYAWLNNSAHNKTDENIWEKTTNGRKKLKYEQARSIRELYIEGYDIHELSRIFNCSYESIYKIVTNKTFKGV